MSSDAVRAEGLSKKYRRTGALTGVDLTLAEGESLVLIGHNGAGKTTLMKLVLGLAAPTAGRVRVWGEDPCSHTFVSRRAALGYLPENVVFPGGSSGRETLRFHARLKGVPAAAVDAALVRFGLDEAAGRPVRTYSKGMRQRLGLAQAVLGRPRLLVFDEPTSGLDPALRETFYGACQELRALGATLLLSSHSLHEVERRADRVAILRGGHLVAIDTLDGLRARAAMPVSIRARVTPGAACATAARFAGRFRVRHVNERTVDFVCTPSEKVATLRALSSEAAAVEDLEVTTPGLDAIYRHFTGTEEGS